LQNTQKKKGKRAELLSDTRDSEAWPVAFCLAKIDIESRDDEKRMKRDKQNKKGRARKGISWQR